MKLHAALLAILIVSMFAAGCATDSMPSEKSMNSIQGHIIKISMLDRFRSLLGFRARVPLPATYLIELSDGDRKNPLFATVDIEKYQRFQRDNPKVFEQMVWMNYAHPEGQSIIYSTEAMQRLAHFIALLETGQDFPFSGMLSGSFQRFPAGSPHFALFFNETVVRDLYLAHAALSLYVEVNRLVPWSITSYSNDNLALLFSGRRFVNFVPAGSVTGYTFSKNYINENGLPGVTDWNPMIGYDFMRDNGFVKPTQQETIYAFTNWMRENVVHIGTNDEERFTAEYGYNETVPVDFMLYPPEGWRHLSVGCWGATSIYWILLSPFNIPVQKSLTLGSHRGAVFPTANLAIGHGDDVYNMYNRRAVQEVPVERIFYDNLSEFNAMVNPILEPYMGRTPDRLAQSSYLNGKRALQNAYDAMAYPLLDKRASDFIRGEHRLEDSLRTDFWRPLFEEEEIQEMLSAMDAEILRIGEGDYRLGWSRINEGIVRAP